MSEIFKCPFCNKKYVRKDALMEHIANSHEDECYGLPPQQVYFNWKNKYPLSKDHGLSVVSGKPTKFNLTTCRYERFADEHDRQLYREMFKKRMIQTYGKETLLDDPKYQAEHMLANRKITNVYTWANGEKTIYTGTYERKFLEYLEDTLKWENPTDIMAPAPQIFPYIDPETGKRRNHIPDFYITSLNLIVNIKAADNKGYRLRDIEIEKAQDKAIQASNFNYIKIYDNEFDRFENALSIIYNKPEKRVFLESSQAFEQFNNDLTE
jgi:hypothetical protein